MTTTVEEKRETFTQGPWIVKHDKRGLPYVGVKSDPWTYEGTVATVEQEKDARLIAAAPEMLKALKDLVKEFDAYESAMCKRFSAGHEDYGRQRELARLAIAKAEGGGV